jgi:hypothetical protein
MIDDKLTYDRRAFLSVAGVVGVGALLAACGNGNDKGAGEAATTTTTTRDANDVALLRTASSLEQLEIAIYKRGLDGGLIKTPAVVDSVKVLMAQHEQHAALFDGHTTRLGGSPFGQVNPVLLAQLQPRLTDEAGVLRAALDAAQLAEATYQAAVGGVGDARLNLILMSVAGVEARHSALISTLVNQPTAAASFATTERAVAVGTGV